MVHSTLSLEGFPAAGVEKVHRLLGILNELDAEPALAGKLALHGGTALNLFCLGLPRLSVDIDLNYIGAVDRDSMLVERPDVERAIEAVGRSLGYNIGRGPTSDSGGAFHLQYPSIAGSDHVKIDVNYRNRSPLLPVEHRTVTLDDARATFPVEADIELIAGKLRALVGRVAVRDLYDVHLIAHVFPDLVADGDETLLRRVILYYLATSDPYPKPFEVRKRFANRQPDIQADLVPMLAPGTAPDLNHMIHVADEFLTDVSQPRTGEELEFMERATVADLQPDLLFAEYPQIRAIGQNVWMGSGVSVLFQPS